MSHSKSNDDERSALRVLHCPTNVGGNAQGLAVAERDLGLESWAVSFSQTGFGYPVDELVPIGPGARLRSESRRWRLLWRALRKYDVVHFNFGSSMFPLRVPFSHPGMRTKGRVARWLHGTYAGLFEQRDLAWLKRAGVGIAVTYQGDDARQGDFCREHFDISPANEVEPGYYDDADDECKRRRIARVARYADRIYAVNPDLLHVLPARAEFLPYASVDPRAWMPVGPPPGQRSRPVLLHAPSHRRVKGTGYVLEAVRRLQHEDRLDFEFVLVEKLSHAEARRLYERADLLVDQLLAGWYGALAVELMALGKPAVCYLREEDLKFLPPEMRADLPLINATPQTIYQVLKQWLTVRRDGLADRGRQSRYYVERWHDPVKIAGRLKADYEAIARPQNRA